MNPTERIAWLTADDFDILYVDGKVAQTRDVTEPSVQTLAGLLGTGAAQYVIPDDLYEELFNGTYPDDLATIPLDRCRRYILA